MKNRTIESKNEYNKSRNEVSKRIKMIHEENQRMLAKKCKESPKVFWNYVNRVRMIKERSNELKTTVGGKEVKVSDDKERAELFARFFASVYVKEPNLTSCDLKMRPTEFKMESFSINKYNIQKN